MSLVGKNNEQNTADPVTFEDDATSIGGVYGSEGILEGLQVTPGAAAGSVNISAGRFVIDVGTSAKGVFYYGGGSSVALADNTSNVYNLVVAKIDTANATSTIEILGGSAFTDPDLTEASNVYYLPIARVAGTGGAITNADIAQGIYQVTNNATVETIGAAVSLAEKMTNGWVPMTAWTWSAYSSTTKILEVTVPSDATLLYSPGMRVSWLQDTYGVGYGIINKVEATTLHIHVQNSITPNNTDNFESPYFTTTKAPFGFPPKNEFVVDFEPTGSTQSSPAVSTAYNLGGSITCGVGDWSVLWDFTLGGDTPTDSIVEIDYAIGTVAGAGGAWAANNQDIYSSTTYRFFGDAGAGWNELSIQLNIPSLSIASEDLIYLNLQAGTASLQRIRVTYTNSASLKNPTKLINNYY